MELFLFPSPGTCLQCEVCLGLGMNCSGSIQECNTGENTCFHALIESSTNGQKKSIQAIRGCVTSRVCGWSPAIFHSEVKYKVAFTCCTGDSCRTTFPQLPEESFIPNGLYCPCKPKVESNYCNNAWLACTEEESQCLNFTETLTFGLAKVQNSITGCATPSACNTEDMNKKILEKLGFSMVQHTCTQASRLQSSAPGNTKLLLPVFIGLILARLLA
ncbi:phospholipase A2 inhibitor 25 kDa subunit-like [Alligator sinensis]|uniref:Phospholipase A2 inhibitor 25 kDa subunit-like n=1 Tax=Alligator sinensis TaxID=38654 RepID=A0A1U7SQ44_ALLSI|nr:phospholipase A2 inhibitor 25 kDa subunit-like [Alligator sinensis]